MEEMIARWIRETIQEIERAKKNQNLSKVMEMKKLQRALRDMRHKVLNLRD